MKETEIRHHINSTLYEEIIKRGKDQLYQSSGSDALEYLLQDRKYNKRDLKKTDWFFIDHEENIRDYLKSKFPDKEAEIDALSLQGAYGDNFDVGLPLRDIDGNCSGYVKRSWEPEGIEINGSKNIRWDCIKGSKKSIPFNLDNCNGYGTIIIVEGYPDAAILPTMGIENVIAIGQGRFSKKYTKLLKKTNVKNIILIFDNDKPDENGDVHSYENIDSAIEILNDAGFNVFIINPKKLHPHKDPDEFVVNKGVNKLKKILNNPLTIGQWYVEKKINKYNLKNKIEKSNALNDVLSIAISIDDAEIFNDLKEHTIKKFKITVEAFDKKFNQHIEIKKIEEEKLEYQNYFDIGQKLTHEDSLEAVEAYISEHKSIIISRIVTEKIETYKEEKAIQDIQGSNNGFKTGYPSLDSGLMIPTGATSVIAGRPSHGKTSFMMNLSMNILRDYKNSVTALFSYEETKAKLYIKHLNILSHHVINWTRSNENLYLLRNYLKGNNDNIPQIEGGKKLYQKYAIENRLFLFDKHYYIDELVTILAYLKENFNLQIAFIDYIQKIKIKEKTFGRQTDLQAISTELLNCSTTLDIAIVVGAQFRRVDGNTGESFEKIVKLDQLRESGDIEQDANTVFGLWNEGMVRNEKDDKSRKQLGSPNALGQTVNMKVAVLKNKDAEPGWSVDFDFHRPIMTISEKNE
jgi:replicative DNA helicase